LRKWGGRGGHVPSVQKKEKRGGKKGQRNSGREILDAHPIQMGVLLVGQGGKKKAGRDGRRGEKNVNPRPVWESPTLWTVGERDRMEPLEEGGGPSFEISPCLRKSFVIWGGGKKKGSGKSETTDLVAETIKGLTDVGSFLEKRGGACVLHSGQGKRGEKKKKGQSFLSRPGGGAEECHRPLKD